MVVGKIYEHDDNLDHIKHENYTARSTLLNRPLHRAVQPLKGFYL
jgi:hypothetical protein